VESKHVKKWAELEGKVLAATQDASRLGKFDRKNGDGILWSAPHSADQMRMGRLRPREPYTASLARLLGDGVDGSLAVWGPAEGDPNWDDCHPFKDTLADLASGYDLVVDLHGMSDDHGVDLCAALGQRPTQEAVVLARRASVAASAHGLKLSVNHPFNARRPSTITCFLETRGTAAFQLYIARRLRRPAEDAAGALQLLTFLEDYSTAVRTPKPIADKLEPRQVAAAL
jgi:hypothetical protein